MRNTYEVEIGKQLIEECMGGGVVEALEVY